MLSMDNPLRANKRAKPQTASLYRERYIGTRLRERLSHRQHKPSVTSGFIKSYDSSRHDFKPSRPKPAR